MEKIFNEILGMSVDAVWLIGAVIIVRALLQKSPMYFRKILWGLVGIRLLLPFSFESVLSLVPDETHQVTDRVVTQVNAAPVEETLSFFDIAPFIWCIVGFGFLIYGVISYIRLKLKIIDGVLIKDNIYQSDRIESPFVFGFIKPKIYLPYGLDETTQKCVLAHEETHIKYADHILKVVSFVVLCAHWFNPLVWVAYFMLCKDIELSCDENVIKKYDVEECKQYARALLELGVNKVKLTACPVAFGEVSIKKRIKSVICYKKASKILVLASLCLCVGVSVCFMTEPKVKAKESESPKVSAEETTEPATEVVTEPVTEPNKETEAEPDPKSAAKSDAKLTTQSTTEPVVESTTQIVIEKINESDNTEITKPLIVVEAPTFRNPFDTAPYEEYDPVRDEAADAGVFANAEEKDALIAILENNNELE